MTRPVQMLLGRSYFMYQIVCITFAGRTTIVKLKHLIIPTFQYTLLYDSEEGFNQHCFTDRLVVVTHAGTTTNEQDVGKVPRSEKYPCGRHSRSPV